MSTLFPSVLRISHLLSRSRECVGLRESISGQTTKCNFEPDLGPSSTLPQLPDPGLAPSNRVGPPSSPPS